MVLPAPPDREKEVPGEGTRNLRTPTLQALVTIVGKMLPGLVFQHQPTP